MKRKGVSKDEGARHARVTCPASPAGDDLGMVSRSLLAAAAFSLAACASLIAPDVSPEPAALRSGAYKLDPNHASLIFKVNHLDYSLYVGRFERFDASLDFDEKDPAAAQVEAVIDMTTLDVANDAFAQTLTGPDWFDAERFPQARFRSTAIAVGGANKGAMTGDLTLHGVTRPVTLDVVFNGGARDILRGGYVVGFSARGSIDRSAFGVDAFDGIVGDAVAIEIEAEFVRR
jgi:polyisoprenoid-binding protein YceI